jgi:hypothetical protein
MPTGLPWHPVGVQQIEDELALDNLPQLPYLTIGVRSLRVNATAIPFGDT